MPFLKEQIDLINNELIATAFNYKQFKTGLFGNIAKSVFDEGKVYPASISVSGSIEKYLGIDDTYPIQVYHRITGKRYVTKADSAQYGNGYTKLFEQTSAAMIVFARQSKINLTAEQLEALIVANFPDRIASTSFTSLTGVESINVTLVSSDLDAQTVFAAEYRNVDYPLGIEDILLRINYTIETAFNKDCLNICEPC